MNKSACELLSFIRQSPSPFHAVCRMEQELALLRRQLGAEPFEPKNFFEEW